ncbi:nicotinate-nucleotide adenylyltransferase [Brevibacillus fluminis]|uniref:Probable nicotinate-nucleotide adenylyltransferase n=1 Tax=Brevibacillus fluminis TaxID=511487 RepID=A0A3M8D3R1_9BACL|nr:nicotinate-nucleotide adenylyltransferase [Brevibacillus fluminis]RNB82339.1 nicotinate-nucleotide adenylyltransferase [Brevibacillus fluminis]
MIERSKEERSRKRVGILGGTFDPIHHSHLIAAEQAREQAQLDEVWFMPARIPPHKQGKGISSEEHRLAMIELAIAENPAFRVTDIEFTRSGPSYTYDTMSQLTELYPDIAFSFIMGGDMVEILPKWYRIDELIELVPLIGLMRPGSHVEENQYTKHVHFIDMPKWELSSSFIREKCAAGQSIRYFVPDAVARYIKEQMLYE